MASGRANGKITPSVFVKSGENMGENTETAGVASVTPAAPSLSVTPEKPVAQIVAPRPIAAIVDEFWRAISTHPDARLLFIDPPSPPSPNEALPRLPLTAQKRMQIKFVYKK